jgi:hypothetical protein
VLPKKKKAKWIKKHNVRVKMIKRSVKSIGE